MEKAVTTLLLSAELSPWQWLMIVITVLCWAVVGVMLVEYLFNKRWMRRARGREIRRGVSRARSARLRECESRKVA